MIVIARIRSLPLLFLVVFTQAALAADEPSADEFFEKEVRPLLAERCWKCHGEPGKKPKGGLVLTSRERVLQGGDSGPAVVIGKPEESLLLQAIQYRDEPKMPPDAKLNDREIDVLSRWVTRGLPWPEIKAVTPTPPASGQPFVISEDQRKFWSFQPLRSVEPPALERTNWCKTEIDHFLLAAMETIGLSPAMPADKRTLVRRATFDLTGLPPTPYDVDAFLKNDSPTAFAAVVDRLLASPAYGERWARHWLDLVRYADSLDSRDSGGEGDIREAWRYRDWVVNALNADMPYDEFVRNQIAGDLLPAGDSPSGDDAFNVPGTIASTMLAIGNWGNGDADKDKILTDIADDQVDVVSRTFMGLTVACARCHDHKFDPISQRDYYALAGVFFSTHILAKLTPKGAGEQIQSIPLASKAALLRRQQHTDRIAELEKSLKTNRDEQAKTLARTLRPQAGRYLLAVHDYRDVKEHNASASLDDFARERGLISVALRQWIDRLGVGESKPFAVPVQNILGNPGVVAWKGPSDTPSATGNTTENSLTILTFTLPPRSISVHPGPASGVAVGWRSPMSGDVRVTGRLADADPAGGDGVAWILEHRDSLGAKTLATGDIPNGGAMALGQGQGADALSSVDVKPGDWLRLIVLPKTAHTCDTTTVDLVISSWNDSSTWDLTRDCLPDLLAANPHADRLGHEGVWRFDETANAKANDKDLEALLAAWRKSVGDATDRSIVERASEAFGSSFSIEDARSPFWLDGDAAESAFSDDARIALAKIRTELDALRRNPPPSLEFANAAQDGGVPESPHAGVHDVRIHHRGRYDRLGEITPRGFPQILVNTTTESIKKGSGRIELANWLTRPDHPLTARVMVNRIWQHHFGAGIVRTPSNFGKLGERPTHPELLDWLALRFMKDGWSMKAMHRKIMLSAAYQQSSAPSPEALRLDADNRLFSRMNRRRLEAEALRDHLLAAAGRLDTRQGGPAANDFVTPRRSLYIKSVRSTPIPFAPLFDAPDSTALVDARTSSTVAPQALFLLNNPFVLEQARSLAQRANSPPERDTDARIAWVYNLLFARSPSNEETAHGNNLLNRSSSPPTIEAWESYCQVLLCLNEFIYID
jgi:cytochrome c553